MHGTASTSSAPRTDTRSRVQKVALELFAEQGYEKTSLREIAERLGVTKAALYYHFKSKEDIVHSFTDDYFAELDALLDWARDKPRGDADPPRDPGPLRRHRAGRQRGLPLPGAEPGLDAVHGRGQGAVRAVPQPARRARRPARGPRRPAARPGAGHHRRAVRRRDLPCSTCSKSTTRTSSGPSCWRSPPT